MVSVLAAQRVRAIKTEGGRKNLENQYAIEMLNITKKFPGIIANDNITLQLKKGEIHALLGENGAGKSTLMSVLFGLYQPEEGIIKKDGKVVSIKDPNDATALGIGMVHQHFKLVDVFTVLDNIILGAETTKCGFLQKKEARKKVEEISKRYGLNVDLDAKVEDITVGMQQRVEILKMLYRDNEILIFDEPTAVLTPQEIEELMATMKEFAREGKSILFISHKLNEIMEVSDRVSVLRKGKYIGTVNTSETTKQELSNMMVGRPVQLEVTKDEAKPAGEVLKVDHLCVHSHVQKRNAVNDVSFTVRAGEIVCIAGIDGNGQTELVYGLTGLDKPSSGTITLCGKDISHASIRHRGEHMSHIPEDRHKHGLVLDFTLEQNMVLQRFNEPRFENHGFINNKAVRDYANYLIDKFDVRSGQGAITRARSMSGGNQQKAIIAREVDRDKDLIVAVQPTRGLDVGAIEFIHSQLVAERDRGKAILLVSLELDEVMSLSDRILVMYEGEIVGELDPKKTTVEELGLYMMVGRPVQLEVTKDEAKPAGEVLKVDHLCVHSHVQKRNAVNDVSFTVRAGEIVCIAGIDGNGQTELVYGLTGLDKPSSGTITLCGKDISHASIRHRGEHMSHIPEDRHKHGLVLDFTLEQNMVLQRFNEPRFENHGFINNKAVRDYANYLIDKFDVRSGQGAITRARSMSGGNQQKAIIAREVDRDKDLIVAVQPTRGLDVGAIEFIHSQLVAERDRGKAILLVSLELDEVMSLSDRILVMYEGEIVGELDPKKTTVEELGLYMAGAKRMAKEEAAV